MWRSKFISLLLSFFKQSPQQWQYSPMTSMVNEENNGLHAVGRRKILLGDVLNLLHFGYVLKLLV